MLQRNVVLVLLNESEGVWEGVGSGGRCFQKHWCSGFLEFSEKLKVFQQEREIRKERLSGTRLQNMLNLV